MQGVGAGRRAVDGHDLRSGAVLDLLSHRGGVGTPPKSRVRQPGGLRGPGGEMAAHDAEEVDEVLSDPAGLEPRLDWVGDHVSLAGMELLGEGVARLEDWMLVFLAFEVAFRMT